MQNVLCKKGEGVILQGSFGQYNSIEIKIHPVLGFMWKATATVRIVNRALREVNVFEWAGDYRPATREVLKRVLEDQIEEELEQYLGRESYKRREEGNCDDH